ncbi:MAG TPA: hypothetical protein VJ456_13925 [Acidimicrobiia bacterium]|nr:hypothetical protein [Acidimicrobiia bacterium]HTC81277.1 hypothetical protein [Acidimicrobiia bacterium]
MAIYVPRARRRRNLILVGVAGLVLGLVLGGVIGRSSAPTVEDRVRSVRSEARAVAAQLRVVSFHESAATPSLAVNGDAGADLALRRTETDLRRLFRRAPWVGTKTRSDLLSDTVALRAEAPTQARTEAFGRKVDALAGRIEATFGASG